MTPTRTKILIPNRRLALRIVTFLLDKDMTFSFIYRVYLTVEIPHITAKQTTTILAGFGLLTSEVEITDDP
jgi:hypothetical protein